ncbi:MAG TPA: DNA-processing protein DprA [Gemmatimonas sp.]|nr:DNA-processing protein DprA [Gemmatimonas sp.]
MDGVHGGTNHDSGRDALAIRYDDADYPARLRELHDAPAVIHVRGTLYTAHAPAVAIVGARNATGYGIRVAKALATACARAGVAVISGLARGIDGASHEAALAAGGRTVAVLGTGLDVVYPRAHARLQADVAAHGLLLSELSATSSGHQGSFPRRNRIIAALADITVVVEAGERSGSLITADYALELHRTVACVPNAIDVSGAVGSNALLKRGAEPILHPDDVLSLLKLTATPTPGPLLDGDAASCWDALQKGARDSAAISRISGLSARASASALAALEIEGLVSIDLVGTVTPSIAAFTASRRALHA